MSGYNREREGRLRGVVKSKRFRLAVREPSVDPSFRDRFLADLCRNSSFHGLNHFVDEERTLIEKVLWAILLAMAVVGTVYSIRAIWFNYIQRSTETVVETTYFKNAQIAFPAVILCQASRVDWTKAQELASANIPEYSNETKPAILALLKALSAVEFGEFDEFEQMLPHQKVFPQLKTLRISDLLLKVMRRCDEVFNGRCWWRSHELDCCTIFELHKTEFGYCYSFNSDLSEQSKKLSVVKNGIDSYWRDPDGVIRPRKCGSRGQWSGLRIIASTPRTIIPPLTPLKPGIKVLVGEPRAYFIGGELTVPAGQHGLIHIWGDRIYSAERLRNLSPSKRHCLYSDEETALGLPYYLRQNCKADCYKDHVYRYCNCSPDFMFFEANDNRPKYPPCTVSDLLCLSKHNNIFNNVLPKYVTSYQSDRDESGIMCDCKADCTHQMYVAEVTGAGNSNFSNEVFLDIHFRQSTCILYRTDLMLGWLDLIVSFGGCTGLFLGGSILSCFELVYFVTIRLYCQWRAWNEIHPESTDRKKSTEKAGP